MKFTTKTIQPTGRYKSFHKPVHEIKFNRLVVGSIEPTPPFTINLMVVKEDVNSGGNPNTKWRWAKFKHEFNSIEDAKKFVKQQEFFDAILRKYKLFMDSEENDKEIEPEDYLAEVLKICKKIDCRAIREILHSSYPVDFLEAFIQGLEDELERIHK